MWSVEFRLIPPRYWDRTNLLLVTGLKIQKKKNKWITKTLTKKYTKWTPQTVNEWSADDKELTDTCTGYVTNCSLFCQQIHVIGKAEKNKRKKARGLGYENHLIHFLLDLCKSFWWILSIGRPTGLNLGELCSSFIWYKISVFSWLHPPNGIWL